MSDTELKSKWELELEERKKLEAKANEERHKLIRSIATKMDGWTIEDVKDMNIRWGTLIDKQGRRFNIVGSRNKKGMLCILGDWTGLPRIDGRMNFPSQLGAIERNEDDPSINISQKKSPERIAKEIEGRFLPDFIKVWDKCIEILNKTKNWQDKRWKKMEGLQKYFYGDKIRGTGGSYELNHYGGGGDGASITAKPYGETIKISIDDVSYEIIIEIFELLKKRGAL